MILNLLTSKSHFTIIMEFFGLCMKITIFTLSIFLRKKKPENAKEYFKKAEKSLSKTNKIFLWGVTYNNLSGYYNQQQEYFVAYKYAEQTLFKLETSVF